MERFTYSFYYIPTFLYLTTFKMFWLHVNNFCRVCWKVLVSPSPKTSTLLTQWKLTFHMHYCGHLFLDLLPYSRSSKSLLFQLLFIFNMTKYQKWAFHCLDSMQLESLQYSCCGSERVLKYEYYWFFHFLTVGFWWFSFIFLWLMANNLFSGGNWHILSIDCSPMLGWFWPEPKAKCSSVCCCL